MSSEARDEGQGEEEIVVNMIETPRGKVPEFESTFRALEKISARLLEQDEKIERLIANFSSGSAPTVQIKNVLDALEYLKAELEDLKKRVQIIEDGVGEIQERLNLLDYVADLVERYLRTRED